MSDLARTAFSYHVTLQSNETSRFRGTRLGGHPASGRLNQSSGNILDNAVLIAAPPLEGCQELEGAS